MEAMDSYEASSLIFTKVKSIDPENATKIMGYILIQDLAEKDLMRLAFGPENLLHSMVIRAKIHLGLSSNAPPTPSSPSTLNPIARPPGLTAVGSNPFSQSSPRIVPNGFPSSPSPSSPSSHLWPLSGLSSNASNSNNSPKSSPLMPYDNLRSASFPPFSNGGGFGGGGGEGSTSSAGAGELVDDGHLNDYLSFLSEDLEFNPDWANGDSASAQFHRRSFSASDASFCADEIGGGGGFKPCLYFKRGYCKNGTACKFVHGAGGSFIAEAAEFEQHEEMMRLKAAAVAAAAVQQQHQQRLMAGLSPSVYNKYLNFLLQQQHHDPQRAAAIMMGEEMLKFGRGRPDRNDYLSMAEKMNSASRQIYLTFPAESTFKDEDVSEYFNKFGPVQDVRIPYQQKRMFGFVTFVHAETVRFILSKGNPHFICDSRVLVKPYKEKGKILDKRQQQHQQHQVERGDFSTCLSPSGMDSRESFDFPMGGRMFYSSQESMFRRKLEQAELQQAIEFQGRRFMNLQLPEFKSDRLHHHQRSLSVGAPVLLHHQSFSPNSHNLNLPFDTIPQDFGEEGHGGDDDESPVVTVTLPPSVSAQQLQRDESLASVPNNDQVSIAEDLDLQKSVEQALPDNLFASPTKSCVERLSDKSEVKENDTNPNETDSALPDNLIGS